MSNIPV